MSLSNYAENLVAKWLFTGDSATRPTAWHVALFTSDPTDAGSGTEVSGGSYARKSASFTVTSDMARNSAGVEFDAATASWGTVTHFGVYDASTGGNLIVHGALTSSVAISSGDVLRFDAGELDVTFS
ncbi:hypothetical protein ACGYLO_16570 [Sulfitobacter sp. 1A13353]|uniref:phage tail fiber protein n=1 Tax=Sulfitobacter sp. 1A13353 TaxID=3368568 RepID=UPI0037456E07